MWQSRVGTPSGLSNLLCLCSSRCSLLVGISPVIWRCIRTATLLKQNMIYPLPDTNRRTTKFAVKCHRRAWEQIHPNLSHPAVSYLCHMNFFVSLSYEIVVWSCPISWHYKKNTLRPQQGLICNVLLHIFMDLFCFLRFRIIRTVDAYEWRTVGVWATWSPSFND
jgi:hypothetical protein